VRSTSLIRLIHLKKSVDNDRGTRVFNITKEDFEVMKSKVSIVIILIALLVVCCVAAAVFYTNKSTDKELPIIKKAPDFELVNQESEPIRLNQLLGKVKVASFMYVKCNMLSMCPTTTKNFRRLQESLGEEFGKNVVLLGVTFDPESDTPGALKKYGQLYGADFSNWHFLTGTKGAVEKVCEDYKIIHEREESGSIRHSMITFLIDRDNNVRRMYFANKWKPEEIKEDIIAILSKVGE